VSWILDLAASGTGQVAAEQRLEHQDERVLFATGNLLPEHIRRHRPHLRNGNTHGSVNLLSMLSGSWFAVRTEAFDRKDRKELAKYAKKGFASFAILGELCGLRCCFLDATSAVNRAVYRPDSGIEKTFIL